MAKYTYFYQITINYNGSTFSGRGFVERKRKAKPSEIYDVAASGIIKEYRGIVGENYAVVSFNCWRDKVM